MFKNQLMFLLVNHHFERIYPVATFDETAKTSHPWWFHHFGQAALRSPIDAGAPWSGL